MKKFLSILLAICMVFAMSSVAMAADTTVAKIGNDSYDSFNDAVVAANAMTGDVTVEIYGKVEYSASTPNLTGSYDSIHFVGKTVDAEISITRDGSGGYISGGGNDCDVSFSDLILSKPTGAFANDAGFMNVYFTVYRVESVTYNNCTFPDGACAQGCPVTYNECTFKNMTSGEYSLWVYANTTVTVNEGTFDGVRGAKMYGEGAAKTGNLVLNDSVFTENVIEKPAIVLTYGESVTLESNTYPAKGVFELDADGAPNGTAVTADIEDIDCITDGKDDCGVLVDGKIYTTVSDVVNIAEFGSEVTLMYPTTETAEFDYGVVIYDNGYEAENITVKESTIENPVAKIVKDNSAEILCADLKTAIAAAKDGDTVQLLASYSDWKAVQIGKTITLDLNGFDINRTFGGLAVDVTDGTVTITGNGKISGSASGMLVADNAALIVEEGVTVEGRDGHGIENKGALTIDGATVSATEYGVALYEGSVTMNSGSVSGQYGIAAYTDTKVTINDGTVTGTVAGLSGHGQYHGTTFTIQGGTISAENGVGIYHPQNGTLNISGGTISGATGINMKSGTLTVTGGTINGTGEQADYEFVGGGFKCTGDALVIESCDYPGGAPTAAITGGTFNSANADAVASYAGNDVTEVVTGFVSGGTFSDASVEDYLAEGYVLESYKDAAGNTIYGAGVPYEITFDVPEGATVVVKDADGNVLEAKAGVYTVFDEKEYTYTVTKEGYVTKTGKVTVNGKDETIKVELEAVPEGPALIDPTKCELGEKCPLAAFDDADAKAWYHAGVHYCLEAGLMVGTGETTFAPNEGATRAMIITMLYRLEFGELDKPYVGEIEFSDLEVGKWYTNAMVWAAKVGILEGFEDGTCRPEALITREQMACFLYRYADYKKADLAGDHDLTLAFPEDGDTVSEWAEAAMSWATGNELIVGHNTDLLDPQGNATRAQVAEVFYRLCTGDIIPAE